MQTQTLSPIPATQVSCAGAHPAAHPAELWDAIEQGIAENVRIILAPPGDPAGSDREEAGAIAARKIRALETAARVLERAEKARTRIDRGAQNPVHPDPIQPEPQTNPFAAENEKLLPSERAKIPQTAPPAVVHANHTTSIAAPAQTGALSQASATSPIDPAASANAAVPSDRPASQADPASPAAIAPKSPPPENGSALPTSSHRSSQSLPLKYGKQIPPKSTQPAQTSTPPTPKTLFPYAPTENLGRSCLSEYLSKEDELPTDPKELLALHRKATEFLGPEFNQLLQELGVNAPSPQYASPRRKR